MKRTRSAGIIAKVEELNQVIKTRSEAEKRERELKDLLNNWLAAVVPGSDAGAAVRAGELLLIKRICSRTYLNKEALAKKLGSLAKYERETIYAEIRVEPVDGGGRSAEQEEKAAA